MNRNQNSTWNGTKNKSKNLNLYNTHLKMFNKNVTYTTIRMHLIMQDCNPEI